MPRKLADVMSSCRSLESRDTRFSLKCQSDKVSPVRLPKATWQPHIRSITSLLILQALPEVEGYRQNHSMEAARSSLLAIVANSREDDIICTQFKSFTHLRREGNMKRKFGRVEVKPKLRYIGQVNESLQYNLHHRPKLASFFLHRRPQDNICPSVGADRKDGAERPSCTMSGLFQAVSRTHLHLLRPGPRRFVSDYSIF